MPDSKKRQSPVVGHSRSSKHGSNSEQERQNITTPDIPEEPDPGDTVLEEPKAPTPPPPPPPVDVMKKEPILLPLIIDSYTGDLDEDGFYHGNGCAILKGGIKYNGSFTHGKMDGQGTLIWPNGTIFSGDITLNSITGKGCQDKLCIVVAMKFYCSST